MARTTYAAVIKIIESDVTITTDMGPFIETANMLITKVCTDYDETVDLIQLELIERWLSAHFYAIRDQRRDTEKAGPVSEKVQYKVDLHLDQTIYGQQAMLLDTSLALAALNNNMKNAVAITPSMTWVGTEDWGLDLE